MFQGFVALGGEFLGLLVVEAGGVASEPDAAPTYRVYGPDGVLMPAGSGACEAVDAGSVAGCTPGTPAVLLSPAHNLVTGMKVTVSGVGGVAGVAGTFTVTALDQDSFSLDGSAATGAYTAGGSWHVTGLYAPRVAVDPARGYAAGSTYTVLVLALVAGSEVTEVLTFVAA